MSEFIEPLFHTEIRSVFSKAVDGEYEQRFNLVSKVYVCHSDKGYDGQHALRDG